MKKIIANWNNFPRKTVEELKWGEQNLNSTQGPLIARGLGRCYGDASLSDSVFDMLSHNEIIEFDEKTGIIVCQSGVSLENILNLIVPKGWFLPVTPGTKYITVGGALASDVHGKNHHVEGSFGDHVIEVKMVLPDGNLQICGPDLKEDLYNATRGGMGLTGIITEVKFKLKKIESSYINLHQIKAANLKEVISLFIENKQATYSMAWIDCLKGGSGFGRSIFMMGEHASLKEVGLEKIKNAFPNNKKSKLKWPFYLPSFALNKVSIMMFNWLYYHKNLKKKQRSITHFDSFFYPLDSILEWNKMYGKKGFVQYQFVLPLETSEEGLTKIMTKIRDKGWGSFLAVLKLFGKQDSLISFPMEGFTLALDFPIRHGLFEFLDELDEIVLHYKGRLYLSKDARSKPSMMVNYPNGREFVSLINKYNPERKVESGLSKRLGI